MKPTEDDFKKAVLESEYRAAVIRAQQLWPFRDNKGSAEHQELLQVMSTIIVYEGLLSGLTIEKEIQ